MERRRNGVEVESRSDSFDNGHRISHGVGKLVVNRIEGDALLFQGSAIFGCHRYIFSVESGVLSLCET
jgi:hypothetical protein